MFDIAVGNTWLLGSVSMPLTPEEQVSLDAAINVLLRSIGDINVLPSYYCTFRYFTGSCSY